MITKSDLIILSDNHGRVGSTMTRMRVAITSIPVSLQWAPREFLRDVSGATSGKSKKGDSAARVRSAVRILVVVSYGIPLAHTTKESSPGME